MKDIENRVGRKIKTSNVSIFTFKINSQSLSIKKTSTLGSINVKMIFFI